MPRSWAWVIDGYRSHCNYRRLRPLLRPDPRSRSAPRAGWLASSPLVRRDSRRVDAEPPEKQPESQPRATGAHALPHGRGYPRLSRNGSFAARRFTDLARPRRPARSRSRDPFRSGADCHLQPHGLPSRIRGPARRGGLSPRRVVFRTPRRRIGRVLRGGSTPETGFEKPADDSGSISLEVGGGRIATDGCSFEKHRKPPLIRDSEYALWPITGQRALPGMESALPWNTRAIPVSRNFQASLGANHPVAQSSWQRRSST